MRIIVRAFMLGIITLLSFQIVVFSQQVAKKISYPASPDGIIGFLEFRPSDYGSQKHPLIIFLHGLGERGNGSTEINSVTTNGIPTLCSKGATMRFTVAGQTSSFVVLSPQLSNSYGFWPTFYVKEMINYAKANLQIDPNRIYVTGLSLGGGGVWRLITDAENFDYSFDGQIAAAAPVCGTQEENDFNYCTTVGANHLPVWAHHSMDDNLVSVGATQHAEMLSKNCGVTPAMKTTYYERAGHGGAWFFAYDTGHANATVNVNGTQLSYTANPNLYEWFLSNTRSNTPVYTAPIAHAGTAQSITLPVSTVTLSGTGDGNNGATIVAYSWTKLSGPAGAVISLPLLNTTLVTGLVQGSYVFALTVTDNHGLSASSNVTVTVNAAASSNQPPVASGGYDRNIIQPTNSVTVDGSGSDPDGYIAAYSWTAVSGPAGANIISPGAPSTLLTNLVPGKYVFNLKVTDNSGATASSNVNVNVDIPPVVNIAANNISLTLPSNTATLDGNASTDPDGMISGWEWSKTSGPSGYSFTNQYAGITAVNNLEQGVYVFTLKVTDNALGVSYSTVTVTVNPAPAAPPSAAPPSVNQAPVAVAGGDEKITLPASSVTLDGGGSYDPDGKIIEYYWVQVSGPSSTPIANYFASVTTAGNLVEGEYIFVLQVKDNNGGLSYSTKKVTVLAAPPPAANRPPVAIAGSDEKLTLPVNSVTLDGGASYDPDGKIVEYYWVQVSGPSSTPIANYFASVTTAGNLVEGEYIFVLQVKDDNGLLAYATKTVKVQAPSGSTAGAGTLLGFMKTAAGPYQACDDASSNGRTPIYGTGIANGNYLYTDAALTQKYDGGWNWFSFTPVQGGPVAYAFAVYPSGAILLLRDCSAGVYLRQTANAGIATAEEDMAALKRIKDAAMVPAAAVTLNIYPNPVSSSATIELTSDDNGIKIINLYNAGGILQTKFNWNVTRGRNVFSLKNTAALKAGLYVIDIRNSNGTQAGRLKFIKMQ